MTPAFDLIYQRIRREVEQARIPMFTIDQVIECLDRLRAGHSRDLDDIRNGRTIEPRETKTIPRQIIGTPGNDNDKKR